MWEYVKGSEADFEGAPEWASQVIKHDNGNGSAYTEKLSPLDSFSAGWKITGQRRKVDDLQSRVNDANLGDALKEMFKDTAPVDNKYNRQCKGVTIDVYDVLLAFNVTNPALQHLVKKALCTGLRGHKDKSQDLQDILDSAKRALELESDK